jgi:COX assembly protein 2
MHPHLHTKDNVSQSSLPSLTLHPVASNKLSDCEEIMTALDECQAKGFLWKTMGMCTNLKHDVNMCLRAERLDRTAKNRETARLKREKVNKRWAEIDANS